MGTRKKTSELVFNLQWRHKLDNGGDKSNVIGMYDTPTTTSNFEMFKSYLLKNSGVAGNDVKVTYLTDDGQEWIIDSQEWFEIALNAFRLKARLGEIIYLKLDKISSMRHQMIRKHSNDVETQFDLDSMDNSLVAAPEWFTAYMKQFKRDVVEEVTIAVSSNLIANSKEKDAVPSVATTSKKIKPESSKRTRKHLVLGEIPIEKELMKTFKFDRKLESKLDKLDAKTKKIKEKKQALINKIESDEHRYMGKFSFIDDDDVEKKHQEKKPILITKFDGKMTDVKNCEIFVDTEATSAMNASLVNSLNSGIYEHMIGGEVYLHSWDVLNSGKLPWTPYTQLRLTWGSSELIPSVKSIRCPCLKPGEGGTISVRFEIPKKPGTYESYWNFYDRDVRFGTSLNCCVVVEEPLASIIPDEYCKTPSSKAMSPKEVIETFFCQPPGFIHLEEDTQTRKVAGLAEEKPSCPVPVVTGDSEKIVCLTHGLEATIASSPQIEDGKKHVKKDLDAFTVSVPKDTKIEKVLRFPNGVETQSVETSVNVKGETGQAGNGFYNTQPFEHPQLQNLTSEQMERVKKLYENAVDVTRFEVGFAEPPQTTRVDPFGTPNAVMDLSQKIEDLKIAVDSDSEWESVWSYEKSKNTEENLTVDGRVPATNKYGIQEKDLIVDLSKSSKENSVAEIPIEKVVSKEETNTNSTQDNNNNNGTVDNNNSSGESISEIASDASSDLSSGYDVLSAPVCDEKEDDGSGYVYITIDGNKLPVPKHILRPDFLANAEEAPGPLNSIEDEKLAEVKDDNKENVSVEVSSGEKNKAGLFPGVPTMDNPEENIVGMSHCSAACSSFSDINSGRLFIFPQNHPGYEVVSSANIENQQTPASNDLSQIYTWVKSETQYTFEDLQNASAINPVTLKTDPYGPLDQSQPSLFVSTSSTPSSEHHPPPKPEHPKVQFCCAKPIVFPHPPCPYASGPVPSCPNTSGVTPPYADCARTSPYPHVPNFQQSVHQPRDVPPFSTQEVPTAPPQQLKTSDESPAHGVPVHILPENLVSGAVNVASSAINTARSVINMIVPPKTEPGRWANGHWITENPESIRAKNLCILAEMGFWDADLNATLLARYNDDIARVVSELIQ